MNKRYQDLQVKAGEYVPMGRKDYPEDDPFLHLVNAPKDREMTIDEQYPYVDDSFGYKWRNYFCYYVLLHICIRIKLRVQMGLRFKGREVLRKYRQQFKGGAITLANHMYRLDCPCTLLAVRAIHTTRIPMFAPNFRTKDSIFLQMVGGVPIPEAEVGMSALKKFNEAFDEFHRRGYWFHIFPESCRWDFYKPLRPFQKGAFTMSYKYNMPLLPCVITYRERKGIFRLFGPKELPLLTVTIGEPLFPDTTQPRKEEVDRLREKAHEQMVAMAGIENNTWPVTWEER